LGRFLSEKVFDHYTATAEHFTAGQRSELFAKKKPALRPTENTLRQVAGDPFPTGGNSSQAWYQMFRLLNLIQLMA
jgi:hypothetical protein